MKKRKKEDSEKTAAELWEEAAKERRFADVLACIALVLSFIALIAKP